MDNREYAMWQRANGSGKRSVSRPCVDCSPAFAHEMRQEERCNGIPGPLTRRHLA